VTSRILRFLSWLTVKHPLSVIVAVAVLTVLLCSNIHNLRIGTDLIDLFGSSTPQWQVVNDFTQKLGYGNQLFVVIETPEPSEEMAERMEAAGDRLIREMNQSGYFRFAKCSLSEDELLSMTRLFVWHFPAFIRPEQWDALKERLREERIKSIVQRRGAGLVTAFSPLGTEYFVADPLGLAELSAGAGRGLIDSTNFDLEWGSGNHFFSRDQRALLVIAEPKFPATNHEFAEQVVKWTRAHIAALLQGEEFRRPRLQATMAGAYVYAEEDRGFIQKNIWFVSLLSIIGNVVLCLLIYRRIPLLLLSFVPTSLGILWATGLISYYPGELNLISLSFIAILAGLGDDQVIHFFNRVPQEWVAGTGIDEAMKKTFLTTGTSILFCMMTIGTSTVALAISRFKGLEEFGLVLTVGLLMLMVHTLFTVPAVMRVWWKVAPPSAPESVMFRFLPSVARVLAGAIARHAKIIFAVATGVFLVALALLPSFNMGRKLQISRGKDSAAIVGQLRLAEKFGIEGPPEMILVEGSEQEVLRRTEGLTAALASLRDRGTLKSVFSPSSVVPSWETQARRSQILKEVDLGKSAESLRKALQSAGFNLKPFQPVLDQLRELGRHGARPLSVEEVNRYLPQGLLESNIRRIGPDRYIAAIAFYPAHPDAPEAIPEATVQALRQQFGPFAEFSFPKISRELQTQIYRASRRALLFALAGIVLIVYLCFRDVAITMLVLMPIAFAVVVTFGVLSLTRHPFSFMALTALPLILGIGIDNGIHLVGRYLQSEERDIVAVVKASGAALVQSNLTTIIGFGALMASTFEPLAELGLVTAVGVGIALVGAMWVLPAVVLVFRIRQRMA
jgi:predicted RND superfamily exporter protein